MSITDRIRKHLFDVVEAGNAILLFTDGMTEQDFLADELVQSAVERKFEIIGKPSTALPVRTMRSWH
jgi:uncharacterized protein with HEPN domain